MTTAYLEEQYRLSEVPIEQWVLAALRLQHGLALRARARPRRRARPLRAAPSGRRCGSLCAMLAVSLAGLILL